MSNIHLMLSSAYAMVLLSFAVAMRLLYVRVQEMKEKRIHPQATSTSLQSAARLQDVRASDNFRNLFEVPVLFYALVACAAAVSHVPGWLVVGAWLFFALRVAHSVIQCTYNNVMHRFSVFLLGFGVLVALWSAFVMTLPARP